MQEKLAALWIEIQEKVQLYWAEIKEHGLTGLRQVIREQALVLRTKAQAKATATWRWVTAKIKAVSVSKQAIVQVAAILAAVSLWLVFKAAPGAMPPALAMTTVVAYLALIVALLAYAGVALIFRCEAR